MTGRLLGARILKLETRRARPDELLVVWRRPDGDVAKALKGVTFAKGDKVICAEWFEDGPLPEPRWYGERLSQAMPAAEFEQLNRSIDRIAGRPGSKTARFAPVPGFTGERVTQMSDAALIHAVLGVQT